MGLGEHSYFRLLGCSSHIVFPSNRYMLHLGLSVSLESIHILVETILPSPGCRNFPWDS